MKFWSRRSKITETGGWRWRWCMDGLQEERTDPLESVPTSESPAGGGKEGGGSVDGNKVSGALREKRRCVRPAPEAWFSSVVGRMRFWILRIWGR